MSIFYKGKQIAGNEVTLSEVKNQSKEEVKILQKEGANQLAIVSKKVEEAVGVAIGTYLDIASNQTYTPSGYLLRDGAEYNANQFQDLWNKWLVKNVYYDYKVNGAINNPINNDGTLSIFTKSSIFSIMMTTVVHTNTNTTTYQDLKGEQRIYFTTGDDINTEQCILNYGDIQVIISGGELLIGDYKVSTIISSNTTYYLSNRPNETNNTSFDIYFSEDNGVEETIYTNFSLKNLSKYFGVQGSKIDGYENTPFLGYYDLKRSYYTALRNGELTNIPYIEKLNWSLDSLLNVCTYLEYEKQIEKFGYCEKIGVASKQVEVFCTNPNIDISYNPNWQRLISGDITEWIYTSTIKNYTRKFAHYGVPVSQAHIVNNGDVTLQKTFLGFSYSSSSSDTQSYFIHFSTLSNIDNSQPIIVAIKNNEIHKITLEDINAQPNTEYWLKLDLTKVSSSNFTVSISISNDNLSYTTISDITSVTSYSNIHIGGTISTTINGQKISIETLINSYIIHGYTSYYVQNNKEPEYLAYNELRWIDQQGSILLFEDFYKYHNIVISDCGNEGDILTVKYNNIIRTPLANPNNRVLIEKKEPTELDPTWYNLYSDGWCEQGGITTPSASTANKEVVLGVEYRDISYQVLIGNQYTASATSVSCVVTSTKTTTGFTIADAKNANYYTYWKTQGYTDKVVEGSTRPYVVVANGELNESAMNWSQWATSLEGKANADLTNVTFTQTLIDKFISWNMPDYNSGISVTFPISGTEFIAPCDGIYVTNVYYNNRQSYLYINGIQAFMYYDHSDSIIQYPMYVPLQKGDTIYWSASLTNDFSIFYPLKGVN